MKEENEEERDLELRKKIETDWVEWDENKRADSSISMCDLLSSLRVVGKERTRNDGKQNGSLIFQDMKNQGC